jgi:hypothetical protein
MSRNSGKGALPEKDMLPAAWGNSWPNQSKKTLRIMQARLKKSETQPLETWEWLQTAQPSSVTPGPASAESRGQGVSGNVRRPWPCHWRAGHTVLPGILFTPPCTIVKSKRTDVIVRKSALEMIKGKQAEYQWAPEGSAQFAKAAMLGEKVPWVWNPRYAQSHQQQQNLASQGWARKHRSVIPATWEIEVRGLQL